VVLSRVILNGFMPQQNQKLTERELIELAVRLAASSKSEDDKRIHPQVGAVVSRDGHVLSTGYRGERYEGAHAEESALLKLNVDETIGATVYSTLEPCTTRGKTPCSLLLIQRGITRLVYGISTRILIFAAKVNGCWRNMLLR
jgi:pyrimidine deaminase RibD-like protein